MKAKANELERGEKWEEPRFSTGKINEENQLIRQREEIARKCSNCKNMENLVKADKDTKYSMNRILKDICLPFLPIASQ